MALPIGMLLQGGLAAGQLIGGLFGKKTKRPTMKMSGATNEMVGSARMDANATQRAGRSFADQNIRQNTANSVADVKGSTNDVNKILAAASAAQGAENNAMQNQDMLDVESQEQAKRRLQGALSQKSAEQQRIWDYNVGGKYQQDETRKQQLIGSGVQNFMSLGQDASVFKFMKDNKML